MKTDNLYREIQDARRGSDVFGLVEKVAFFIHLKYPKSPDDINWERAQARVFSWGVNKYQGFPELRMSFEQIVHDTLCHEAYNQHQNRDFWNEQGNSFQDWVYAQEQLAKGVQVFSGDY